MFKIKVVELSYPGAGSGEAFTLEVNEEGVDALRDIIREFDASKAYHGGKVQYPTLIYTPVYVDDKGKGHFVAMRVVDV